MLLPRQVVAGIGVGVGGVWRVAGGGQTMVDLPVTLSNGTSIPVDASALQPGAYWISLWQSGKLLGNTGFMKI